MDFKLSDEFVKENGLTEDQVKAISTHVDSEYLPEVKKEYDGVANKNAEGILAGAAQYAATELGVKIEREQGEKYGDFLKRIHAEGLKQKNDQIAQKEKEIAEKLKNFNGGEEYKAQLETMKADLDKYKQQAAELEPLRGLDEKYKTAQEQLSGLKLSVAFNSVKPIFPDTTNEYEAKAKWDTFRKGVEDKWTLEIVENEPIAISKENEHLRKPLKELVEKDVAIQDLLKGRQQGGTGARPADKFKVEGLSFEIPKGATSEELTKLVREYVEKELKIPFADPKYAAKFSELYSKAREGLNKAA